MCKLGSQVHYIKLCIFSRLVNHSAFNEAVKSYRDGLLSSNGRTRTYSDAKSVP